MRDASRINSRPIWYICFDEGAPHWWDRFLKLKWTHCYALKWDGYNWMKFDPTLSHFVIDILPDCHESPVPSDAHTIVKVVCEASVIRYRTPWLLCPQTCVEAIKGILGIRRFWLFTPWQLYRYLDRTQGLTHGPTENTAAVSGTEAS